jgi:hypothetical protein
MLSLRCCSLTSHLMASRSMIVGRFSTIAVLCIFSLTACEANPPEIFSGIDLTPVEAIAHLKNKADGDSAVIEGKVGTIAPLVGQVVFEVQDHTGVMWVLSDNRAPAPNSQVKVRGILRTQQGERYLEQN